jgi:hypothetical protein
MEEGAGFPTTEVMGYCRMFLRDMKAVSGGFQSPVRSSAFRRLGPIDLLKEELRTGMEEGAGFPTVEPKNRTSNH